MKQNKLLTLKRILGKKMFIISNYEKFEGYVGVIEDILNETTVSVNDGSSSLKNVSIFDIRSMPYEF